MTSINHTISAAGVKENAQYLSIKDKKLRAKAQCCVNLIPGAWGWKLAMHTLKQAYGIFDPAPVPNVGDTNGNYICTYSDHTTGDYIFTAKSKVGNHA